MSARVFHPLETSLSSSALSSLRSLCASDPFGRATAASAGLDPMRWARVASRNNGSSSSSSSSCYMPVSLAIPFRPTAKVGNVYGTMHGGALMTVSDFVATFHASAIAASATATASASACCSSSSASASAPPPPPQKVRTVHASCRFHNAVAISAGKPLVVRSTAVTSGANNASFLVDILPAEACACPTFLFDESSGEWSVVLSEDSGGQGSSATLVKNSCDDALPFSTFTRATYVKSWS